MSQTTTITLQNGRKHMVKLDSSKSNHKLPIIDVSGMFSDKLEDRKRVAKEVGKAAHENGFFYLTGHRVDENGFKDCFEEAKKFFALPMEEKLEVYTQKLGKSFAGYHPLEWAAANPSAQKKKDLYEGFNCNYDANFDPEHEGPKEPSVNMWPAEPVGFREAVFKYHAELLAFSRKMTRIFALALNLDEHAFDEFIKVPDANLRLLHYPHQEASRDDQNGLGIHTDFTWFTIIAQDTAGGLEVLHESGEWIEAEPIEGTLVMNIADCFMRQTNDYFISTPHRVINKSGMARYSAPFLFGFNLKTLIQPITTCVSEDNPNKYTPMTAEEYFVFRGDIARATESEQYKNKV